MSNVACVFILYNPQHNFEQRIQDLAAVGFTIILVSNAAPPDLLDRLSQSLSVHVLVNGNNVGLATALNRGIVFAFNDPNIQFVALFDQDSSPADSLPLALAQELVDSDSACLGPLLIDEKKPFASYPHTSSVFTKSNPGSIPTSGTVISKGSWATVGPMLDDLFIDGIDHEWCFRACSKGLVVRRSEIHTMKHNMGDVGINLFGTYKPIHRSPFRHYFIVRNSIYLASLPYIPLKWRLLELFKTVRRIFVYAIVSTNRLETIQLLAKAIQDGLFKRLGPLKGSVSGL